MRILLIEDEVKIARALQRALTRQGYAVDVCHDGDEGQAMATTEPYDLAIIDRMIPGAHDGLDVVRAMRQTGTMVPVLLLTALGRTEDKTAGLDSGADDYLVKPFALDELLARVRALLRRPATATTPILTVGDLSLDTTTRQVSRAGQPISLTSREFALLEYLMRHHNRPLSKDAIIAHVWDFDADILPNTVEAYIKHLRAKIDAPFGRPLIHTRRGFGYQLSDEATAD